MSQTRWAYFDTSVLVKRYVKEQGSAAARRLLQRYRFLSSAVAPVEVVSQIDQGLDRVGFTGRKRGGAGGYFITPQMIENRKAAQFTDLLTTAPGIRIEGTMGHMAIRSTRTVGRQGCVTVYVDGSQWQQLEAGDLDSFVRPEEAAAIEVYPAGSATPVEFQTSGQDCAAVVIWTKLNVNRKARSRK